MSCERRESRAHRTEKERAEAFFPLGATTTAADPTRAMREQLQDMRGGAGMGPLLLLVTPVS